MGEVSVGDSMLACRVTVAPYENKRNNNQDNKTPKYLVEQLAARQYKKINK